jgi:hypothetical protein
MAIRLLSSESIDGALTLTGNLTGTSATLTGSLTGTSATFNIGAGNVGLAVYTSAVSTAPNVRFGRNASEYIGFKIQDRNNRIVFRQDETDGNHEAVFDIWSSTTGNKAFVFGVSDSAGATFLSWLTIENSNATFAGNVTTGSSLISSNIIINQITSGTTNGNINLRNNAGSNIVVFNNDLSTTFAGDIIVASGKISTIGGNNMTISGTAANHCGLSFATNAILPATQSATNTNTVDLGASSEKFKDFYYAGAMTGGSATFGGSVNTSGLLTATAIDTDAYLADGSAADLHGRYLGQAIYGSGTGSGDNYGTVADVLRYKQCDIWRKNSSTNVWSNPSDGDTLVQGNYAAKWSGINMEPAYSEYVFYFSNSLGYSFLSQTIVQHSTNGNSFDFYIEIATSTTNPYDTTGWTTKVTKTGISSWPGLTCIQQSWEVGGGYPGLMRIRIVPTWNNSNLINLGSFQAYGSYGTFSHAWSTNFDRSVNFQSKIGVGINPSRALDVTQTALIQGAGNVNMGTLALGPRASGVGKWSTISGAHYNQSSGSGNGSGAAGIMMIGTYGANGENDLYIGGGLYEVNAATRIGFYTHTTDTSTAGGSPRMNIIANGNVGIGATNPGAKLEVNGDILLTYLKATANSVIGGTSVNSSRLSIQDSKNGSESSPHLQILGNGYSAYHWLDTVAYYILTNSTGRQIRIIANSGGVKLSVNATAWQSNSDIALKENLKPLENVLDKIKDYRCVEYNLKESPEDKKIGFIAQDWVDDFPAIVDKDEKDMLGMKYTETIPVLLKAIQELKAEIEILKSK